MADRCSFKECKVDDMTLECFSCKKTFCTTHLACPSHNCSGYKANLRGPKGPVCPLCRMMVPIRRGEDVNMRVDRHIQEGCPKPFQLRVRVVDKKSPAKDEKLPTETLSTHSATAAANAAVKAAIPVTDSDTVNINNIIEPGRLPADLTRGVPPIDFSVPPVPTLNPTKPDKIFPDFEKNFAHFTPTPVSSLTGVHAKPFVTQGERSQMVFSTFLGSTNKAPSSDIKGGRKRFRLLANKHREKYIEFQSKQSRHSHWRAVIGAMVDFYMLQWSTAIRHCRKEAEIEEKDKEDEKNRSGNSRKRRKRSKPKTQTSQIEEASEIDTQLRSLVLPLCNCVCSVAEALMMSELDIAIWSLFLDKLQPDWISLRPPEAQLAALFYAGYSMKMLWSEVEEHQLLVPYLHRQQQDFSARYMEWIRARPNVEFAIPPLVLRKRFQRFQDVAGKIHNSFSHPQDF